MKIKQLLNDYQGFITPHLSESSVIAYVKDVRRYVEDNENFLTATKEDIEMYLSVLASQVKDNGELKFKPASLNRQRASIVSFYNFLVDKSKVTKNPASEIKGISYKKCRQEKIENYLTSSEINQLIHSIENNVSLSPFVKKRDVFMCHLMIYTGIKINELGRLKASQFNFNVGEVTIIDTVGNERVVSLGKASLLIQKNYEDYLIERQQLLKGEANDFLFLSERKSPLSLQLSNYTLNKHRENAGIEKRINNSTLRNTFVMEMFDWGMGIEELSQKLGHTSINFTSTFFSEYIRRQNKTC